MSTRPLSIPERPARPSTWRILSRPLALRVGVNASLWLLWLWLYRPVFPYLEVIFTKEEFRTNQLVLLGAAALIASQARRENTRLRLDRLPHLFMPALALAVGGSGLYLLVERFLEINTLSATLFGLASYGLLGLWMAPARWRQGLPAALLLVGALPFGQHMQTFVGYPMRILTAEIVRAGLQSAGVQSVGVDTILVFENGVAQVDLPCSGVKSLWTGGLFLIAATWIERRRLSLRWLLVAAAFALILFAANLVRVGALVVVGQVAGWRLLAEMLHVPLGVLGFVAACAAAVGLLRRVALPAPRQSGEKGRNALLQPRWLPPALAAVIFLMGLAYAPRTQVAPQGGAPGWELPAEIQAEPMPLSPLEHEWLVEGGAESAERLRFNWRGVSGSMILITSKTWRAHHRPERCFEVYGLRIDSGQTHMAAPDFPIRSVSLGDRANPRLYSAAYWFQSQQHTTDDYATRIWDDLAPQRRRWVLVTILFDGAPDPGAADLQAFYHALRASVQRGLEGGGA